MKTAHKTLAAIFALLAIALFAACSSDADDTGTITATSLAGTTWTASYEGDTITLAFESDGTFTWYDGGYNSSGTYEVSGSTVTIDNELTLTYLSGYLLFGETITFTKN